MVAVLTEGCRGAVATRSPLHPWPPQVAGSGRFPDVEAHAACRGAAGAAEVPPTQHVAIGAADDEGGCCGCLPDDRALGAAAGVEGLGRVPPLTGVLQPELLQVT